MKLLLFTEGTILMHRSARGHPRNEIIRQVKNNDQSVKNYSHYLPISNAAQKVQAWSLQGIDLFYLTSRRSKEDISAIRSVLTKYEFPDGTLLHRKPAEQYADIVKRIKPDILIEDDCESIGEEEIIIHHIKQPLRKTISSIIVPEFGGIDDLPDDVRLLL